MKKVSLVVLVLFIFIQIFPFNVQAAQSNYGVFIGLNPSDINKLTSYKEVVIDASYYTKAQIDFLHKKGVKVYSYLNIGSIETFRSYYNDFVSITLSNYENWDNEKWIDVSNTKWKDYVVNTLAKNLKAKGIDGFFLDNIDVYTQYKNDSTFNGILDIITRLNSAYKLPIIANGGYDFFTKALSKNLALSKLVYGVNTESVYTTINFSNNTFIQNSAIDRQYAVDYLNSLKAKGVNIYIIEYTKDASLKKTIANFYNKLNFKYYISDSLSLN